MRFFTGNDGFNHEGHEDHEEIAYGEFADPFINQGMGCYLFEII